MPKTLSATEVAAITADGLHRVDRGLYLQIRRNGASRSWSLKYRLHGRVRWMGLGSARLNSLTEAKRKAREAQKLLEAKEDPIDARRRLKAKEGMITFEEATTRYIAAHGASWSSAKHGENWLNQLRLHAHPVIGKTPVDQIDSNDIVRVLQPIWAKLPTTAGKIRGRIERVLDWAANAGFRAGTNPALWRGGLEHRLPPLARVQTVVHRVAIPYSDAPGVYGRLATSPHPVAVALRLIALTGVRSAEALGARWDEFELDADIPTWTVPAPRAKSRRPHRVPLAPAVVTMLKALRGDKARGGLLFPGQAPGKPISDVTARLVLRKAAPGMDIHGWRSTLRTWAAEKTSVPREVAEAAIAHVVGSKLEVAYQRSDLFEQRVGLMASWAKFLVG